MKVDSILMTITLLISSAACAAITTPRFISGWDHDSIDSDANARRSEEPRFINGWGHAESTEDSTEDA
ncbi:hypothetical protein F4677DRAFT_450213 [Hypoxylon crocopeplum]|nr:hypothetical protein F4677DRAFT_450213 [Hypoxylon crocopeplum]